MHNKPALGAARNDLLQHAGYATWAELTTARIADVRAAIAEHADRITLERRLAHLIHDIDAGRPLTAISHRLHDLAEGVAC